MPVLAAELTISLQVAVTIIGAGVAAFVGVKVALAQVQRDVESLKREDDKLSKRLDRLEQKYFEG